MKLPSSQWNGNAKLNATGRHSKLGDKVEWRSGRKEERKYEREERREGGGKGEGLIQAGEDNDGQ